MSLPPWDESRRLPVGRHETTLEGIHDRCVLDAPNRETRQCLYNSLIAYTHLVRRIVGPATLWINGGFMTAKDDAPFDVDVVIHPADWDELEKVEPRDQNRIFGLLTLQDIIVGDPLYIGLDRLQPLGGDLDSFLCFPGQEDVWHDTWSSVKVGGQVIEGARKGYAEVILR